MPLVTIKVFEHEFTDPQTEALIRQVTEAIIPFVGEKLRSNTWVLIEGRQWSLGNRRKSVWA